MSSLASTRNRKNDDKELLEKRCLVSPSHFQQGLLLQDKDRTYNFRFVCQNRVFWINDKQLRSYEN